VAKTIKSETFTDTNRRETNKSTPRRGEKKKRYENLGRIVKQDNKQVSKN
jgi:hypothetical protein